MSIAEEIKDVIKLTKQVNYYGLILTVPVWTKWIAIEENGASLSFFESKPYLREIKCEIEKTKKWYSWTSSEIHAKTQTAYTPWHFFPIKSWKESLLEV